MEANVDAKPHTDSDEIRDLLVNPTRIGFLDVIRRMGARVEIRIPREWMGEPVADVRVAGTAVAPLNIEAAEVPSLVDEIPLLALLATQARGTSTIRGADELRVKESDRIAAVGSALRALGADIDELPDGFIIRGPTPLHGAVGSSGGDHRLAGEGLTGCAEDRLVAERGRFELALDPQGQRVTHPLQAGQGGDDGQDSRRLDRHDHPAAQSSGEVLDKQRAGRAQDN